jgi:hypothetical protein
MLPAPQAGSRQVDLASASSSSRTCSVRARVAHAGLGKSPLLSRGSARWAMTACEVFCREAGTGQSSLLISWAASASTMFIALGASTAASIRAKCQAGTQSRCGQACPAVAIPMGGSGSFGRSATSHTRHLSGAEYTGFRLNHSAIQQSKARPSAYGRSVGSRFS